VKPVEEGSGQAGGAGRVLLYMLRRPHPQSGGGKTRMAKKKRVKSAGSLRAPGVRSMFGLRTVLGS